MDGKWRRRKRRGWEAISRLTQISPGGQHVFSSAWPNELHTLPPFLFRPLPLPLLSLTFLPPDPSTRCLHLAGVNHQSLLRAPASSSSPSISLYYLLSFTSSNASSLFSLSSVSFSPPVFVTLSHLFPGASGEH